MVDRSDSTGYDPIKSIPDPSAVATPIKCHHGLDLSELALPHRLLNQTSAAEPLCADWRARLHEYLGGTVRGLAGVPQAVGGVEDHVHLLIGLRATHTLADFMRN